MKTFILILAVLAAPLASQEKQPQSTAPPETSERSTSAQTSQTEAPPAVQRPQNVVKQTAKPAQPPPPQQLITFTAEQLDQYENKILDRAEKFYAFVVTIIVMVAGVLIPLFVTGLIQYQRRISFAKELAAQSLKFNERLSQSEGSLKKYAEEQTEKLEKDLTQSIFTPLSLAFAGLSGLFSKDESPVGYGLTLQSYVLAMKFYIISQCYGKNIPVSTIIKSLRDTDKGSEITLDTLESVDIVIEDMKGDLNEIVDTGKRVDMESQVRDLQIFVHALIHDKQQTTPPQSA